jgi:outer membrane protein TolC
MTLADCLRQGVEANYNVKLARTARQIAENNVTNAQFLPEVSLGARQSQDRVGTADHLPQSVDRSRYVTNLVAADATLSWRLFDGMGMFATHQTQKELLSQGELNLRNSMERLVADISQQYYFLITQLDRLKANRRYLEISNIRYNQALEKYAIGSISGLEMKQAKIDLNADSSTYVQQQLLTDNAFVTLNSLMNIDLDAQIALCDTIVPNEALSLADLERLAEENNSQILAARSGGRLSELDLRVARSGRYPTLDFNSGYRLNRSSNSSAPPSYTNLNGFSWGFTASMKIFGGMETGRKIRNARLGVERSELLYDQTRQQVMADIRTQFNTYRKNMAMISFVSESADVAMLNLEAAVEMYRLGSMSGVEFREIQRSYMQAEERKLDAILQTKATEIDLLYLSGEIFNGL